MNIDTRNQILSVVLGIIIIALSWLLYESIVTPYQEVKERQAETERVRNRLLSLKDALVQYESKYGHFPPTEGGLDSIVAYLQTDSLMLAMGDTLFMQIPPLTYSPESIVVAPRSNQRFVYTLNDSTRPPLYLLEDPDSDDAIGSLSRTTMRNAPNWN
jgi:type II secretory pathway pseudopilin PulG